MQFLFIDESGYSNNWKADTAKQPYFVLSGYLVNSENYISYCDEIRKRIESLDLDKYDCPLGQGFEIKAKEIYKGSTWWNKNKEKRNFIRDLMLETPKNTQGKTFLIIIDKKKLKNTPYDDPVKLALKFLYERVQRALDEIGEDAICIFDQSSFRDDEMHEASTKLTRDGSFLFYESNFYGFISTKIALNRLKEFYLARSENSIGIQIADYYATFTYQYIKSQKREECDWWNTIYSSLHKNPQNRVSGVGIKLYPK